jgi:hypothetical protein
MLSRRQLTRVAMACDLYGKQAQGAARPDIFGLRREIESTPDNPHLIHTVRRRGYFVSLAGATEAAKASECPWNTAETKVDVLAGRPLLHWWMAETREASAMACLPSQRRTVVGREQRLDRLEREVDGLRTDIQRTPLTVHDSLERRFSGSSRPTGRRPHGGWRWPACG